MLLMSFLKLCIETFYDRFMVLLLLFVLFYITFHFHDERFKPLTLISRLPEFSILSSYCFLIRLQITYLLHHWANEWLLLFHLLTKLSCILSLIGLTSFICCDATKSMVSLFLQCCCCFITNFNRWSKDLWKHTSIYCWFHVALTPLNYLLLI